MLPLASGRPHRGRRAAAALAALLVGVAFVIGPATPGGAVTSRPARIAPATSVTLPTPGATSVLDPTYGLTGDASIDPDATIAFASAIADALAGPVRYPAGPDGTPQAVVYVPPGSYRLNGLLVPSNVRLEIDAGAVLEPIARPDTLTASDPIQLIQLGTHDHTVQVTNVSVVGVNDADNELKARAEPTYGDWDIGRDFTVDLDPDDSGASNDYAFITLINVADFLISDLYVIQNGTAPSCTITDKTCPVTRGPYPLPTTARAAIVFKPSNQSSLPPGPVYDPTNGTLADMYTIGSPFGFGPTQVASGHDLTFTNLYSDGGTTLRIETDDANKRYAGEVQTLHATNIVGQNCNRAVSLSAHKQLNRDVHISRVTAIACNNGLVQSADNVRNSGSFLHSTIHGLTIVGGPSAQIPLPGGRWTTGTSVRAVSTTPGQLTWSANVTNFSCTGTYTSGSKTLVLDEVRRAPHCY